MRQKAAAIDSGLSEAMNLKRGVVDRLRPALLDHFGLATALRPTAKTSAGARAFHATCR